MSEESSSGGIYGAFASKLGSHAAKAGKKIAQSEAGRSAGRAAIKGASDAAAKDLSERYFGGYEDAPKTPAPPPSQDKKSKSLTKGSAHPPPQRPPPHGRHDDDLSDGEQDFEEYKHQLEKKSLPPKPSVMNRFKPSFNKKSKPTQQDKKPSRPPSSSSKPKTYKYNLSKGADWDSLPRAKALYNYRAEMSCDLEFRKGQVIEVMTRTGSQFDWWEGRLEDRVGIFPANYVRLMS